MFGNNEISLTRTRDLESQNQTEYINIIHYYLRRLVEDGKLAINWISSSDMLANGQKLFL